MSGTNAVNYALTPAGLANDKLINYNTKLGKKYWSNSTKKLTKKLYNRGPHNLKMFLERLSYRVEESGWNEITKINNNDLLTQHGTISIKDCRKEATNI